MRLRSTVSVAENTLAGQTEAAFVVKNSILPYLVIETAGMQEIGLLQYQPVLFWCNDFKGEFARRFKESNDVAVKFWIGKAQVDIPFFVCEDQGW